MGPIKYDYIVHIVVLLFGLMIYGVRLELKPRHVLDLLQFLNGSSYSGGFKYISGQNNRTPAILLEDSSRDLALPDIVLRESLLILNENSEITFLARVKQEIGDAGSILSFSSDMLRFLEIESSGRRDEIRFHYTHDQQTLVETFPYRLSDNRWHSLALSLSGNHLTLYVNCNKIYERVIKTVDRTAAGTLKLYVGQRNGQHALFRGALQDVQIVTQAHGYLLQCPEQNSACPTCAQYQDLEQQVKTMYSLYQNLSQKLQQAEERIASLEQCECLKSCTENGTTRKEGEMWEPDQCTTCICVNGTIECRKVDCLPVDCDHPVYRENECCPVCYNKCFYSGQYFEHGETTNPRVCVTCNCNNGRMECEQIDKETACPHLNDCPDDKKLQVHGQCCPVCNGTNFCAKGHNCGPNAECVNLATLAVCQCKLGFHGDAGKNCTDIDECLVRGGKFGHHCNGNTKCVNTIGSYVCQCESGHIPSDPYSCEGTEDTIHSTASLQTSLSILSFLLTVICSLLIL